jgi:hypothetical protein
MKSDSNEGACLPLVCNYPVWQYSLPKQRFFRIFAFAIQIIQNAKQQGSRMPLSALQPIGVGE